MKFMKILIQRIKTNSYFLSCLIIAFLCLICSSLKAEFAPKDSVLLVVKTSDFAVSGEGSNLWWENAKWVKLTNAGKGVNYQTLFKIMYSDSGIYCLFKCEDSKITASLKGDFLDLFNEDVVEAFFWTDESVPIYFEYELSPLNYELPILIPNLNGTFLGWRPWHYEANRKTRHAAHISLDKINGNRVTGWTAEFFIPFTLLKPLANVPAKKGTSWRANFYRIDYDSGSTDWYWQAVQKTFHEFRKFGTITFD
jgi:hypothetical protein